MYYIGQRLTVDGPQYNVPSTRYQVRSMDSKSGYITLQSIVVFL